MDKIEDWDKRNQLCFAISSVSITSSILLKINGVTSNCKEAYDFLTTQYGGTLTVAEVAYLTLSMMRNSDLSKFPFDDDVPFNIKLL